MTVATKPWSPRRARISRKTIAQGMPVDPVYLWFLPLCFFIAQGAMGASVARHSLRPLLIPRVKVHAEARAHCAARSRTHISRSLRGALLSAEARLRAKAGCDEAIHPSLAARWIASLIGRRGAPTRWLAMTEEESRPWSCRSASKRQTRNPRITRYAMEHLKFDAEPVISTRALLRSSVAAFRADPLASPRNDGLNQERLH
jgi:hypothetical protein